MDGLLTGVGALVAVPPRQLLVLRVLGPVQLGTERDVYERHRSHDHARSITGKKE